MADYKNPLDDQEDSPEVRAAKAYQNMLNDEAPAEGDDSIRESGIQLDDIATGGLPLLKAGAAAAKLAPMAAAKAAALAKMAGASAPAAKGLAVAGQVLPRTKIAEVLKKFKPISSDVSEKGAKALEEITKNNIIKEMANVAPKGTSPLELSGDLLGHAVLEATGKEETAQGAKQAAKLLYPEEVKKSKLIEGTPQEIREVYKKETGGDLPLLERNNYLGMAMHPGEDPSKLYVAVNRAKPLTALDDAHVLSHEYQHIAEALKNDGLVGKPYNFKGSLTDINIKRIDPEAAQRYFDTLNFSLNLPEHLKVKDMTSLRKLVSFARNLPGDQGKEVLGVIHREYAPFLRQTLKENPMGYLEHITRNHHADYPGNYEMQKSLELLGLGAGSRQASEEALESTAPMAASQIIPPEEALPMLKKLIKR